MNKMPIIAACIASMTLTIATTSTAAPIHDPYVNAQQHRQHERIQQGVRSGQLTRSETRELANQQRSLRQQERGYKSDGVMTHNERQDMRQDQRGASQNVYTQKHDLEIQPRIAD
jgi:hypothetical protein